MTGKNKAKARAAAAGLLVLILAIIGLLVVPQARAKLDHLAFDSLQNLWPRPYIPVPVRIIDIDEDSLARLGQWPWPRHQLAALIERLRAAGAAAIALDIILAEPDRTAPARVSQSWPLPAAAKAAIAALPDPDALLAETLAGGWVITGFAANQPAPGQQEPDTDGAAKARFVFSGPSPLAGLPDIGHAVRSLPALEQAAAGNGAVAFSADGDGIIRRVPLVVRLGQHLHPSLALEALRVATGKRNILVKTAETGALTQLAIGPLHIPVDAQGAVHLHYTDPRPQRFVPAWKVLDGSANLADIAGHVVFVGASAKGLLDLRLTPAGDIVPGVLMHAEAAEAAQLGALLQRPDWMEGAETLLAVIAGLTLIIAAAWMAPLAGTIAALSVVAALAAVTALLFLGLNMLADPLPAIAAALVAHGATALIRHRQDQAERSFIRGAFARYISPNLVRHLLDNPHSLAVGGERRECSFVMTDLAGFTTLVESADPATLLDVLNGYIDGMVKIAFAHQGTLDRIVGDAVAVMFSAPVAQPDHAARAIACALDMDRFSQDYVARMQAAGHPLGLTRIGVNTGLVTIGNVGGGSISDYRALGDAVNAAARLETVNRHLGTRICVAAATVSQCPDFHGRPVGELVLKGKSQATLAFEPLPDDSDCAAYQAAYELMAAGEPAATAAFAALAGSDPLAAFHLHRLQAGQTGIRVVLAEK
ncbi:CHASE2 domain-containing protein [Magnetospirillum sulfuroxidans]|uniref:Adenylate/guanylate cyclase domain-containing protein n=1 Tax=Magnetospirillum sulfuroxidans TaxID=611300 RepID=A0ABS5IBB7_9PROT|nr:adenylate/guanylate cyclase domain-containing protein [Magnetospirillum sulfuroxidans]MBR9971721.1 adenylate/guanylate cyclase domain-containing protein [Magnetospirillum sulfuroxidans]